MKLKTVLLLIISAALIILSPLHAFAAEYVFDGNSVVIAENGEASIGIIGGADGPTAIMVSGGSSLFLLIALAVAVIAVIIILIIILKRRFKNK